ncbi:unnamed protein product [Cyclocybe aegerita]|uniref:TPR repeat-containing protein n=1 Tax=Cyclocybe aegerita TaxID=1973307 RepID=A0A8S0W4U0_CYCAE|nr:unnamed protein product [Cyclocybe aegerita]
MIDQRVATGRKLFLFPLAPSQVQALDRSRLVLVDSTRARARENCACAGTTEKKTKTAPSREEPILAVDGEEQEVVVAHNHHIHHFHHHPHLPLSPTSPTPSSSSSIASSSSSATSLTPLPPAAQLKKKRRERAIPRHATTSGYYYDVIKPASPAANPLTKTILEGKELFRQGAYPAALAKFTTAIAAQRPRDLPALYLYRSQTLFKLERYREAVRDARKAIELRSTFWEAWIILLDAQLALKDHHACNDTCRQLMASMAGPSCYLSTDECGTRIKAFAKVDEVMGILSTQL